MQFLKQDNKNKRLFLQLKGFMEDTYMALVGDYIGLENFKLPDVAIVESELANLQIPSRLRLGNRLEYFFSFIIRQSNRYKVIVEHIQIFEEKQTLGELDFILFDNQLNQYIHIELGAKLYLYDPDITAEISRWIGPNRRDSLLQKTIKLKEKQFPILYTQAANSVLQKLHLQDEFIQQQVCLKARLFVPKTLLNQAFSLINPLSIKGYYISFATFTSKQYDSFLFFLPEKQDWIVQPMYGEVWFSYIEIVAQVRESLQRKMSPLVWIKKNTMSYETFFITWW